MNTEPILAPADPEPETTSLWSKLFNIFAAPGEVFEEIRNRPPAMAHWLVPALLSCLAGVIFSVTAFSQPDLLATMRQQQVAQMQKMVDAGKMTPEQMEQQLAATGKIFSREVMMGVGIGGSLVMTFVFLAVIALLIWLLADKIFKGGVPLMKSFELVGLATMIHVLGGLVTLLIVLVKGNMAAGPNAAVLLPAIDPTNIVHHLLGALNGFTLWFMAVLAIGVSRVTGRSWGRTAVWIFGVWAVVRVALALGSVFLARLQS